jgi:capsular polysaccharide transport system permease protein
MDNEDRIKAWRERRRAGILPTDPQATALSLAFTRTGALVGDQTAGIQAILRLALDGLEAFPGADVGQRRALYARMTEGVQAGAKERDLSEATTDYWTRRVQLVVRSVEADIRKGVDVFAEGYAPDGLAEADARFLARFRSIARRERAQSLREQRRHATREDIVHTVPMPPEDAADLAQLRPLLTYLHATQRPTGGGQVPRILTIFPLFLLRLEIIQADSRIALLWAFVGPITMVTILSAVYFVNGMSFILGMDVPSFSVGGVVTWYMFRIIVFRSSESYFSGRPFLHLEPVTPLAMALINSVFYLIIYTCILFIMIYVGHAIGVVSIPNDPLGVIACISGVAAIAAAFGLLFAGIASKWEFFLRLAPPIERFLQLFSSVFFVSEQFPAMYRKFILWWPLSHGLQLLRSAYFAAYKSTDASPTYFILGIIVFILIGLAADRLARPNVQPM